MNIHGAVSGPEADLIRLRRDGTRPLRFMGRTIARHDGHVRDARIWHGLGLYRNLTGGYAVEIVAFRDDRRVYQPIRCHAAQFATLDEALTWLEEHDPAGDICPWLVVDPSATALSLFMDLAALQGLCRDVARRYRIGVGVMLAGLGLRTV